MTEVTSLNPFKSHDNEGVDLFDTSNLKLPKVVGHNLLILPLAFEKRTKSGLILTDSTTEAMENRNTVGKVLDMGPLAYKRDRVFFDIKTGENYPYCKVGDWVVFSKLGSGSRIVHNKINYWVIADTQVLYTIDDPREADPDKVILGFDYDGEYTSEH